MDPGSIRSQAIQPLIPSTANQNNNANQNSLVQNALRRLPIPTPVGPISTNQAMAGINAIQNIPTPPMPNMSIPNIPNINPVPIIDPGFYKNIPMPNIDPGFGMPSIPNIDPRFGKGPPIFKENTREGIHRQFPSGMNGWVRRCSANWTKNTWDGNRH